MRKIDKTQNPPQGFAKWVNQKPKHKDENQWFQALYEQQEWDVISELGKHNTQEQYYLCAYCCDRISGEGDVVNEHVEARNINSKRSLDFTNIVASCKTRGQCDDAHKNQPLPLTPLMPECETELKFKISGRVEGLTQRAKDTIQALNLGDNELNNKKLIEKRKYLSDALLFKNGIDPNEGLEDNELLFALIDELSTPRDGQLEAFSPVVINILKQWLYTDMINTGEVKPC